MPSQNSKHTELVVETVLTLSAADIGRFWQNNTGKAFRGKRLISFGLTGSGDITGILCPSGKRCEIEIKTGRGRLTSDQENFRDMILSMGGIHAVIRTPDDIQYFIQRVRAGVL